MASSDVFAVVVVITWWRGVVAVVKGRRRGRVVVDVVVVGLRNGRGWKLFVSCRLNRVVSTVARSPFLDCVFRFIVEVSFFDGRDGRERSESVV